MKKIRLILTGLLLVCSVGLFAQNIQVKGTVTDASTGEVIPFASVSPGGKQRPTVEGTVSVLNIMQPRRFEVFPIQGKESLAVNRHVLRAEQQIAAAVPQRKPRALGQGGCRQDGAQQQDNKPHKTF